MPEPTPAPVSDQPNTETLVSTESLQLTQYIHIDRQNDASEVMKLQKFLNKFEGEELVVDGVYKKVDYEAVKRFQRKYADKVLAPWGITEPTGYVYKKTVEVINNILKNNEDKKDNINIETIPVVLPKEK
jgi:peptidoglycan hydrolase-like protein with peptidoglycan-binding domain